MDSFRRFSPARLMAIAMNTVTQLLRMKIIPFLAVFCMVVVAAGFVFPVFNPHHAAEQQLVQIKSWSLGAMFFFSSIIAIAATSLLLPRDVEDRTLYTILAKPVPRLDYLLGKLIGVLIVIAGGMIVMDIVFCAVLWLKQGMVINDMVESLSELHGNEISRDAIIASATKTIAAQGLNWSLQAGVWSLFLKASVLTTVALLISCFASSTLFTVISAFCVFLLGHGEGMLRDYLFHGGISRIEKAISVLISIICPDMSLFDAVDGVIAGKVIPFADITHMTGIGAMYVVGYFIVAHLIFVEKEL
jgi:hypothetical protein